MFSQEVTDRLQRVILRTSKREKCPYSDSFWSVIYRIRIEHWEILYGPEKLRIRTLFTQSIVLLSSVGFSLVFACLLPAKNNMDRTWNRQDKCGTRKKFIMENKYSWIFGKYLQGSENFWNVPIKDFMQGHALYCIFGFHFEKKNFSAVFKTT